MEQNPYAKVSNSVGCVKASNELHIVLSLVSELVSDVYTGYNYSNKHTCMHVRAHPHTHT